jgi:thiosulfate/3-mercaptopyruvate sulfurtransferase
LHWLVETAWLAEHLHDSSLRIIDVRGEVQPPKELGKPLYLPKPDAYAEGHIPGAVFVDWVHDITDLDDPTPVQIAPPERFRAAMERLGIGDDTFVVAYDDHNNIMAGRLWWALRYYGHDKVAVLNGGYPKWISDGRAVTKDVPVIQHTTFTPKARPELRKTADQILPETQAGAFLLDNRIPTDFTGETQRALRGGHIPGAINLPTGKLLDANLAVLDSETLKARFAEIGLTNPDQPVITYCNGGVNASLVALALDEAGFKNVAVYDGSWNEWGNDFARPVEKSENKD